MARRQDGKQVTFGQGPAGDAIDLPDGELFNIHLAIGKVLRESGIGQVIDKVLQDEEHYNERTVEDEVATARISAFALRMALNKVQADPTDWQPADSWLSDPSDDWQSADDSDSPQSAS